MSLNQGLLRCFILIFFFLLTIPSLQQEASAGQLQLTWADNSNNEDGFKIERKTGTSGTFSLIATVGINVTSYTDTNLTDGATYCYRLLAFNSAGNSANSAEACATVKSTLSITKIGSGTVTSSPAGINCGSDCSEAYTSGTVVVLTASAAAGYTFAGWSGSGCGTGSLTMNGSRTCTATFTAALQTFTLSVNVVKAITSAGPGNGTVTSNPAGINCGSDCSESYNSGTIVALSAIPATGSIFSGWSGSGCSTGSVTMNNNRNCTATFNAQPLQTFGLSVAKTGTGSGTVTSSLAGINCGGDCSESYTSGTVVVLSAVPATGSVFSGWSGSGCSTGSVTMNGSRSCTAAFTNYAFGMSGNVPVRRDYDGDGNVDAAVYRDGTWFILRSSDGGGTETNWGGAPQDIPVPGDYDGDGKTDQAVYRDGVWFILRSSDGGGMGITWGGAPQDLPVPGDYDGDGKTDQAVYRDGVWFILRSSDGGGMGITWGGAPQDLPVPGDYDGDGKTDQAVYRDGVWFILRSSDGGGMGITGAVRRRIYQYQGTMMGMGRRTKPSTGMASGSSCVHPMAAAWE